MLLSQFRDIYTLIKREPSAASNLPRIQKTTKRTLWWLALTEIISVLELVPLMFVVNELSRDTVRPWALALIALSFAALYKIGQQLRTRMDVRRKDAEYGLWWLWWSLGNRKILLQSADWHMQNGTGEKESLVNKNINKFQMLVDELLFVIVPVTIRITLTAVFLFFVHWSFGLLSILIGLAYWPMMLRNERKISPLREEYQERLRECENFGSELNSSWQAIQYHGAEARFANENDALLQAFWYDELPRRRKYLKRINMQDDIVIVGRAAVYALTLGLAYWQAPVTIGALILATSWMEKSLSNYGRYAEFQNSLNKGKQAMVELIEFIKLRPSVMNTDTAKTPVDLNGRLEFKDVSFWYGNSQEGPPTLCGLNLTVEPKQTVALVGHSGGGKSTIASLAMRAYDPTRGEICVDGHNLRDLDYAHLRSNVVGFVPQHVTLFNRSVADNIRLGRPEATLDEVRQAAKQAEADVFIQGLPDGYDTMVGENGLKLSGGQRQRIAIARTLLMQCPIMLLDEATSALDAVSQASVQRTLEARVGTTIVIAHRLSTVLIADKIVVIDKGQKVGEGTHEELLETCQIYRDLVKLELS